MASQSTDTVSPITLTPPDPVPVVAPTQAAGLVPVADDTKSKLEARAEAFVADLVAQDAASPEFGKRVDQLSNMGRKEIAAAAGMSNRFLDRPVRAMDKDSGVGADLAALRRTVEELDPGRQGNLSAPRKFLGIIPFGNKLKNYFDSYTSSQGHIKAILDRLASGKDDTDVAGQVADLNQKVVNWSAPHILSAVDHYYYYLNDISHLPVPLAQPQHLSSAGTKSLPMNPFM
jgi:uncharacterized protein YaaN involved in tellurite resistance